MSRFSLRTGRCLVLAFFTACTGSRAQPERPGGDASIVDAAASEDAGGITRDAAGPDSAVSATDASATDASALPPEPDPARLKPGCFSASGVTPQLSKDSLFSGSTWNDPAVLKMGDEYVMYASSDHGFDGVISIYRLVSKDAQTWSLAPEQPVLAASKLADAWDRKSVETPSVVLFHGSYHMFYTGYPAAFSDTSSYRVGHAVSSDGITWTRDTLPLISPSCPGWTTTNQVCSPAGAPTDFNAFLVGEPGAVVFNGKLHVYFTASGYDADLANPLMTIGLITSTDAKSWSPPQRALVPEQALYPRAKWLGYSTPSAMVLADEIHVFFDVVQETPFAQLALHHARSPTGVSDFVQDAKAIFSASAFPWTSREIRAPAALLDGTSLRLWFAGDDGASTHALSIGEASCAL